MLLSDTTLGKSVTKQYDLVSVKRRWRSAAGKAVTLLCWLINFLIVIIIISGLTSWNQQGQCTCGQRVVEHKHTSIYVSEAICACESAVYTERQSGTCWWSCRCSEWPGCSVSCQSTSILSPFNTSSPSPTHCRCAVRNLNVRLHFSSSSSKKVHL